MFRDSVIRRWTRVLAGRSVVHGLTPGTGNRLFSSPLRPDII